MATEVKKEVPIASQTGLRGNYHLRLKFGEDEIPFDPKLLGVQEFTITLDINRFLPSIRIRFKDAQGILTHFQPFDSKINKIEVDFHRGSEDGDILPNSCTFDVYRRFPDSSLMYDIEGLMSVKELFSPEKCRAFRGDVITSLASIADELGFNSAQISGSLNHEKTLLQAHWTNSEFLKYIRNEIMGKDDEACYYIFTKLVNGDSIFTVANVSDLGKASPKYNIMIGGEAFGVVEGSTKKDFYMPVDKYSFIDNYKVNLIRNTKTKECTYFDYENSEFTGYASNLDNFFSLTDYFLIDGNDDDVSLSRYNGRSNEFTSNFLNKNLNVHYRDMMDLSKMWVTLWGIEDVNPGDIIKVRFAMPIDSLSASKFISKQYEGFWMVERAVHQFSSSFQTSLLLTRSGVDCDRSTTLLQVPEGMRKKK
jgi:hypothetical protein